MLTVQNDPPTILYAQFYVPTNRTGRLSDNVNIYPQSVSGLHDSQESYSVAQNLGTLKFSWRCSSYKGTRCWYSIL